MNSEFINGVDLATRYIQLKRSKDFIEASELCYEIVKLLDEAIKDKNDLNEIWELKDTINWLLKRAD